MKGLLLKDCFTLVKQMKIFLLIIIVFSLVPGYSMSAFAIVYSALLPMSALAYDERSKWDSLAAMMPYKPRDMVLSKYLLGVGAVLAAVVLSFIAQTIVTAVSHAAPDPDLPADLGTLVCAGLLMLSLTLPFMFKFGVERGRIALFVIIGLFMLAVVLLSGKSEGVSLLTALDTASVSATVGAALAASVVILIISILISVRIYAKKEF